MKRDEIWRARVKELLTQMTLEEKAGLLTYRSESVERLGIPAYNWWNEALHGVARAGTATSFPQAIALAASFDEELLHEVADAIATEGRAKYHEFIRQGDRDIYKGLTFWCPNINIFRDPRWGRGHETFGEDPYLTSRLGVAYVKGLQGEGEHLKSAACVKHFAVHSGPEEGRHSFNAVVSKKDLWETYLPAFEACVTEAKAEGIMGAYNRTNGEACCASPTLLQDILREKWGFDGYVVSDCGAIADIHNNHKLTANVEESAALALNAGCNLNCGSVYKAVVRAVEQGLLDEEKVDEAAGHLLMTRMRLGMDEKTEYDEIPFEKVECPKHIRLSRDAAVRGMVLLKNDGILPLQKEKLKTIGVIGPNADSREALWGNYFGTNSFNTTVLEGIRQAADGGTRVLFAAGSHLYRDSTEAGALEDDRASEAVSVAQRSDVVVLCLGLDANIEGEEGDASNEYAAGDKKSLSLPRCQQRLLEKIAATGKPVVLVMMAGSAMDLRFADENENIRAILQAWYPGALGGAAVADILFGDAAPSGKLPVTFYRSSEDLPPFEDYRMKGRTYRYLEKEALYPFGFGLTYSDIYCSGVSCSFREQEDCVMIEAEVRNDSGRAGRDVLQIYVKDMDSSLAVPNYSLCGMQSFVLAGGESKKLTVKVDKRALEVVDEDGNRRLDSRHFLFYAGCSQPDARSEALTGRKVQSVTLEV